MFTQETFPASVFPQATLPFRVGGWVCPPAQGQFAFSFSIGPDHTVTEIIDMGVPVPAMWLDQPAFRRLLDYTAMAVGISYYKAFIPKRIEGPERMLTPRAAAFFERFYREGLGEFAARNTLSVNPKIDHHMIAANDLTLPARLRVPKRSAVLVGGGKDSVVAMGLVKDQEESPFALSVNPKPIMVDCAQRAGLPLISIRRTIDPLLLEWNRRGALNGHVPVTGIIFFLSLIAGCLYGFNTVVAANEQSANEGNTVHQGMPVNHQFSKSDAFERLFRDLIHHDIAPDLNVYSAIRDWSEIAVAARFARSDQFDSIFSSCNGNFKQTPSSQPTRWCGDCPKCRFTALVMAPFMTPERLTRIIGRDLLDDPAQLSGFRALLGIDADPKPWECVGTFDECRTLIHHLGTMPEWRDKTIIRTLAPLLPAADYAALFKQFLTEGS